jgi:hypothetical protein
MARNTVTSTHLDPQEELRVFITEHTGQGFSVLEIAVSGHEFKIFKRLPSGLASDATEALVAALGQVTVEYA